MRMCFNSTESDYTKNAEIKKLDLTKREIAQKIKAVKKEKREDNRYDHAPIKYGAYHVKDEEKINHIKRKNKRYKNSTQRIDTNNIRFDISLLVFDKWFRENQDRFNLKPIITIRDKDSFTIEFEGLIKNIHIYVNAMPEAIMIFEYDNDDIDQQPLEYIGDEKYNPKKGYYDADRVDDLFTYFKTREELYINEVFEAMLKYCNEKLVPENCLYIHLHRGMTSGKVRNKDEYDKLNKDAKYILDNKEGEALFLKEEAWKEIEFNLFDITEKPIIHYTKREK
ncbi:MAG: hypothetical protein KAJ49_04450 [Arcobacteraceae bacterium]|nr:hypothetical protein [Arcobacteraceae bacterium]